MKTFSPIPPQFSSSSQITMMKSLAKEIDNKVKETMMYHKDFNNGCFTKDGFTDSGFTDSGFTEGNFDKADFNENDFTLGNFTDSASSTPEFMF